MLLIIPTIPIQHSNCDAEITGAHRDHAPDVYSLDPVERARLLRKENAKALHIEFHDCEAWESHAIDVIRQLREAVDIPIEVSLGHLPTSMDSLEPLFGAGANRVFLPLGSDLTRFYEIFAIYGRKIVPTLSPSEASPSLLEAFRNKRIDRIGIELSPSTNECDAGIDWEHLDHAVLQANTLSIRITALHGVGGYPDLRRLQSLGPALDSLVLCRALNENRFPCQMIWRELEEEFAHTVNRHSNLWTNPLEGTPHI
jgi:phosphoribosylformimino-5-aminoimidazole carboxamide ribotide isomerase